MRKSEIANLRNLLNQGDVEQAITSFVFMDDLRNSVRDDLKYISYKFDELKWKKTSNRITDEEFMFDSNGIIKDLVDVLNGIENWVEEEDEDEIYLEDWQMELEDEFFAKRERVKTKGEIESNDQINIWKLGTNWGGANPSFYELIKNNSIVICRDKMKFSKNDIVIITKGFTVYAIAKVLETPKDVTLNDTFEVPFEEHHIHFENWVLYAKGEWFELDENERFLYKLQQGICRVRDESIRAKTIELYEKKSKEKVLNESEESIEVIDIQEDTIDFNVFEGKSIRKIEHNEEWWFAVVDVIEVMTDSKNPKAYTNALLRKEPILKDITLYFRVDRKDNEKRQQYLRFANIEGVLRIIMTVPSPKTEPFKLWLASVGKQAIFEAENPFYTVVVKVSNSNLSFDKNRLEAFTNWGKKYGEGHLIIAALAAFPLHITADLLYTIWQNFKNIEGSDIPRVAVSDLLLSGLLHEVSTELFEYAPDMRRSLLQALQEYYGERTILEELGEFMLDYLATHYAEGVAYTEPIREAEEWNALAYYAPERAHAKLVAALNPSAKNYQMRQLRAVFLTEKLQDQSAFRTLDPSVQAGFERVLTLSKGIKPYIQGDYTKAYQQLQTLPEFRIMGENEEHTEGGATLELPKAVVPVPTIDENSPNNKNRLWWCAFGNVSSKVIEKDVEKILENIDLENYELSAVSVETSQGLIHFLEEDDDKRIMSDVDIFLIYYRSRNQTFDTKVFQKTKFIRNYVIISDAPYPTLIGFGDNEHDKIPNLIWIQSTDLTESPYFFNRIGLFTQKLVDVIQNAEKTLTYSELFSRIYTKMTQQTDKQYPQIHAFGTANLQDLFLNGMLKVQNTEGSSLPKMKVGFGDKVKDDFRKQVFEVFEKEGKSLFFDIVGNNDGVDYLIQFNAYDNQYTLETAVGDSLMFPPIRYDNEYELITFFNNIDRVANWQFTLAINSNSTTNSIDQRIDIDFYNLGLNRMSTVEPTDWQQPIVIEVQADKTVYIQLRISNNNPQPLWVSILYLGKDFSVTNTFLTMKQILFNETTHLEYDNNVGLPVHIPFEFLSQGKTTLTEYFKIFISSEKFTTDELNRNSLSMYMENVRDLEYRSNYQTGNWSYQNMMVKTVIMTLKFKKNEEIDLREVIYEPREKLSREDLITLLLKQIADINLQNSFMTRYKISSTDMEDIMQNSRTLILEKVQNMVNLGLENINPKYISSIIESQVNDYLQKKNQTELLEDLPEDLIANFSYLPSNDIDFNKKRMLEDEKLRSNLYNRVKEILSDEELSLLKEWGVNKKPPHQLAEELGLTETQIIDKISELLKYIKSH